MIRLLAAVALCFAAAPSFAQTAQMAVPAAPAVPATPQPATVRVTLTTSEGPIVLAIESERAPISAGNFLRYVDQKRLDGTNFYRAARVADGYGLVQGGTRNDPRKTLKPIPHEPTSVTGLSHGDGTISMGREKPGTAAGDFFITVGAMTSMDADPAQPGDNAGFAAFGHVLAGMDVVRRILDAPKSPTAGEGVMKGQMLAPAIRIVTARRTPAP